MSGLWTGFDWSAIGQAILDGIGAGLTFGWELFLTGVKILASAVKIAWENIDWKAIGQWILDKIEEGIEAAKDALLTFVSEKAEELKKKFTEINWSSVGSGIINGIKGGISSAAAGLATAAKNAASSALDAAKNFLGIESPSRRAAEEIGRPFAEGIAVGIEAETRGIADSLARVLESALSATRRTLRPRRGGGRSN